MLLRNNLSVTTLQSAEMAEDGAVRVLDPSGYKVKLMCIICGVASDWYLLQN
jgi:hypothetical protein